MSTKCTIACGFDPATDFHLYFDYADDLIHLDMYSKGVCVVIPRDAMQEIIKEIKDPNFVLPGPMEEQK